LERPTAKKATMNKKGGKGKAKGGAKAAGGGDDKPKTCSHVKCR